MIVLGVLVVSLLLARLAGVAGARSVDCFPRFSVAIFGSGFDEDRTAIDLAAVERIRKAVSTKGDRDRCTGREVRAWGAVKALVTLGQEPTESSTVYVVFDAGGGVSETETVQRTSERRRS